MSASRRRAHAQLVNDQKLKKILTKYSIRIIDNFYRPSPVQEFLRYHSETPKDRYRRVRSMVRRCVRMLATGKRVRRPLA